MGRRRRFPRPPSRGRRRKESVSGHRQNKPRRTSVTGHHRESWNRVTDREGGAISPPLCPLRAAPSPPAPHLPRCSRTMRKNPKTSRNENEWKGDPRSWPVLHLRVNAEAERLSWWRSSQRVWSSKPDDRVQIEEFVISFKVYHSLRHCARVGGSRNVGTSDQKLSTSSIDSRLLVLTQHYLKNSGETETDSVFEDLQFPLCTLIGDAQTANLQIRSECTPRRGRAARRTRPPRTTPDIKRNFVLDLICVGTCAPPRSSPLSRDALPANTFRYVAKVSASGASSRWVPVCADLDSSSSAATRVPVRATSACNSLKLNQSYNYKIGCHDRTSRTRFVGSAFRMQP
ncbi:hypothetical protein EVAR_94359_1 [Eumeta japonica]|uniref:Uncharacterized protein n=1 Tax=Eumeta variegata TaxID=151549 RepID=A0A4C1TPY3_EUMVA|nr:hypothetical protein EVAR_94359_1 [Eumeta japonica]